MHRASLLVVAAAVMGTAQTVQAQTRLPLAIEVRGGYTIPNGDWNDEELFDNGFAAGATITAMFAPTMGLYAGYEMVRFSSDEAEELGVDADGTDAGFRAGLHSRIPLASAPSITLFHEVGVVYNTFEISVSDGDSSVELESEGALGFEYGAGVAVQAGPRLEVTPSIMVRQHKVEFEDFEGGDTMQYFLLSVGLRLRL